jgi:hypothetical protein
MSAGAMDAGTARRVLSRVSHAQRFPVGRLVPPVGLLASSVRGLEELVLALRPEPQSLAGVHLERLADWIESEVGDPEGAAGVREALRAAPSYVEACRTVHERLEERVRLARAVAGAEADAEAGDDSRRGRQ